MVFNIDTEYYDRVINSYEIMCKHNERYIQSLKAMNTNLQRIIELKDEIMKDNDRHCEKLSIRASENLYRKVEAESKLRILMGRLEVSEEELEQYIKEWRECPEVEEEQTEE